MGVSRAGNQDDEPAGRLKCRAARAVPREAQAAEVEGSFDALAELRARTRAQRHTPAEELVRESRSER